jgi:phosphoribosylaminoimidazolecarboxamide formyltransferase/IMP cyclohydrolase
MERSGGELSRETRWQLMRKAFATTAAYDSAIISTLERVHLNDHFELHPETGFPEALRLSYCKAMDLRYGENPHQKAAMYTDGSGRGLASARQLQGKELSYNNLVDLQAAWDLASEFDEPFCAIIKHTNPCGSAIGKNLIEAFHRAFECDPVSAFGSIIALNRPVDGDTAEAIAGLRHNGVALFIECIIAPQFDEAARARFAKRKDLRVLEIDPCEMKRVIKAISGGLLMQDNDLRRIDPVELKIVSERRPSEQEMRDLIFAWKVCKHVKSNAVLYARDGRGIGVGAGQMSRVDAARFGAMKAVLPLPGCVAASDAFFPFPDGVEEIARAGATAIIQPGGSVRDPEVIDVINRLGMAMVFTGVRHFRH